MDEDTINPLDLDQWVFYVLKTQEINDYPRSEYSITLKSLGKLSRGIKYLSKKEELNNKIKRLTS